MRWSTTHAAGDDRSGRATASGRKPVSFTDALRRLAAGLRTDDATGIDRQPHRPGRQSHESANVGPKPTR